MEITQCFHKHKETIRSELPVQTEGAVGGCLAALVVDQTKMNLIRTLACGAPVYTILVAVTGQMWVEADHVVVHGRTCTAVGETNRLGYPLLFQGYLVGICYTRKTKSEKA